MTRKKVFLNGRFLTRPLTGVQRTAFELVRALDNLLSQNPIEHQKFEFILIYSGTIITPITLKHITLLKKGITTGNVWEQFELPLYTRGHLLISMCTISTLLKRKQIVIVHDASSFVNPQYFSFGFRSWYKFALPLLSKLSRRVVTVSQFSKKELARHAGFNENKITVIYNAANHLLDFKEPDADFKHRINALKPYCLAVSSLGANKNFRGLSKAIQQIDFSKYNMLVAGGEVKALKYEVDEDAVTYLGYVSNEQLRYLYNNASLFIFPSFYEGFGIPPLEAMISGCPVIASNTSSIPEVLGDACEYFNPASADDMAKKIFTLINNNDRLNELREQGYKRASLYSWERSSMQLYSLVKEYAA